MNFERGVFTHRGLGIEPDIPENSASAIKAALTKGVEFGYPVYVEYDIGLTHDNVAVLMHDTTLDRTTNGTGLLRDYDYEQIQDLQLLDSQGRITQERIPRLDEVMEGNEETIHYQDIKVPNDLVVLRQVQEFEMLDRVLFASEFPSALIPIKKREPKAVVGLVTVDPPTDNELEELVENGINFVSNWIGTSSNRAINRISKHGLSTLVYSYGDQLEWTPKMKRDTARVLEHQGVKGVITNHLPQVLTMITGRATAA